MLVLVREVVSFNSVATTDFFVDRGIGTQSGFHSPLRPHKPLANGATIK